MFRLFVTPVLGALLAASACGPPPRPRRPSDADFRSIAQGRALEIMAEVLSAQGLQAGSGWQVNVGQDAPFDVDLRLTGTHYGIEWVDPQDRARHGEFLPDPDPSGLLRLIPGYGDDASVQILVLDHRSFRYDPDRQRVQRGSPGAREAESRLRTATRDFVVYVRGQGGAATRP